MILKTQYMSLTSAIQKIEQSLRTNPVFMDIVQGTSEGSNVTIEADGLFFLLHRNPNFDLLDRIERL